MKRKKYGYNSAGEYVGKLKRAHRSKHRPSLSLRCFRDGTLDVDLKTGEVWSRARKEPRRMSPLENRKGHLYVHLSRRNGRSKPDARGRRDERMSAWVHRLVYMKKLATMRARLKTGKADNWREFVEDLDPQIDVDHRNKNRQDNRARNLRVVRHNHHGRRSSAKWTEADEQAVREFNEVA